MSHDGVSPDFEAVIIGAGFGGMGAAIALKRLGITSIRILDRADDLGGTWHLNRYPGLSVDIASVTYSYSFEPNPDWTRLFARGSELKAYCDHVATKYELRPLMRFGTDVEQVRYREADAQWEVHVRGEPVITARILIVATGYLSRPSTPEIPGLDGFRGKIIHTADWDPTIDLKGKRAGVIGTGATSVQLLPEIAPKLSHLTVFQRTPIWVSPKIDPKFPKLVRRMFRAVPASQRVLRWINTSALEIGTSLAILNQRQFPWSTWVAEFVCKANLRRAVRDPALRKQLTPKYPLGCKRPTMSNTYFPVFARKNVDLVSSSIVRVEEDGIVTQDGAKHPLDVLVMATGYKVWERDGFHSIVGKNGRELRDLWQDTEFVSYEGITMPGFPNLFYLPAPFSYTGLSYFSTIESHMAHITRCLGEMKKQNARTFEPTVEATDRFVARMRKRFGTSILTPGLCSAANSYYFDPHGKPSLIRPLTTLGALAQARSFPLTDYTFEGASVRLGAGGQRASQSVASR